MQISLGRIKQYVDLYFKKYNQKIDDDQALSELLALVRLIKIINK
jgi:hypothetical protein